MKAIYTVIMVNPDIGNKKILFNRLLHNYAYGEIRLLLSFLIMVSGIFIFLLITGFVISGDMTRTDIKILNFFREKTDIHRALGPEGLLYVMRDITALGGTTFSVLVTVIAAGFFLLEKKYRSAIFVLLATLGGGIVEIILKDVIGRQRPDAVYRLVNVSTQSFPSGHSMMAAVIYLSIAVLLARTQKRAVSRIYIVGVGLFVTFLIGLSRVYLGVHYPSDVLAGWILGMTWASFIWFLTWYLEIKNRQGSLKEFVKDPAFQNGFNNGHAKR